MSAANPVELRNEVMKRALERGIDEHTVKTSSTSMLMGMIEESKAGGGDRKKKAKEVERPISRSHVQLEAEYRPTHPVDEDTKTVVDLEFITSTTNPADQKYQRFRSLAAIKHDLQQAVQVNSGLIDSHRAHLDEDDMLAIQREIESVQQQLQLVHKEMRDIQVWFQEMEEQKRAFYQQFLRQSKDVSGNLSTHFQKKLDNIQAYMKQVHSGLGI